MRLCVYQLTVAVVKRVAVVYQLPLLYYLLLLPLDPISLTWLLDMAVVAC